MDIFTNIFAGLGLFFIGVRLISNNLTRLAGVRLRRLITRALSGNRSAALFGLTAGAIMQSLNAVTHLLVAMVTSGTLPIKLAFPIISWANIGTSMLVLLATVDLHSLVLLLLGFTGLSYFLKLDDSSRYRYTVGALLGVGLLFLGIDFIKQGSALLKNSEWLTGLLISTANYSYAGFAMGALVAFIAQSSSTITVLAMAMAATGILSFVTGSMVVLGAGLGSAFSVWLLNATLRGSAKQLVLFQIVLKMLGVMVMLLMFIPDQLSGNNYIERALNWIGLSPAAQLAFVFVLLQIVSDLAMRLVRIPVHSFVTNYAPPTETEIIGRPSYIHDEALVEPEGALVLVDLEQQRLLRSLPEYLAPLRNESDELPVAIKERCKAESKVVVLCDQFLTELIDHDISREALEKSMVLRDKNKLLLSLQTCLLDLSSLGGNEGVPQETRSLIGGIVESTHMMLETLSDAAASAGSDDLDILRALTHDRSEMMDSVRKAAMGSTLSAEAQEMTFAATSLFEQCVWLLRRYVLLLDEENAKQPESTW